MFVYYEFYEQKNNYMTEKQILSFIYNVNYFYIKFDIIS